MAHFIENIVLNVMNTFKISFREFSANVLREKRDYPADGSVNVAF